MNGFRDLINSIAQLVHNRSDLQYVLWRGQIHLMGSDVDGGRVGCAHYGRVRTRVRLGKAAEMHVG